MNTRFLTTVSVIGLLAAATPALAEVKVNSNTSGSLTTDIKKTWNNVKQDTTETYENIKASLIGDESNEVKPLLIDLRKTATGMIGKAVYNNKGERVGTIKDIILDANGRANMVVIADGEFPGYSGKLVAFDYNIIAHQDADGDVIAPLTEDKIDKAAEFSYDKEASSNKVRVIPNNGYSVARLLDARLLNPKKEAVADVDNIAFKNGQASELIVGFDKVLGLGGEKAAMEYKSAQLVQNGSELNFQLSASQADHFESYRKTLTN